MRTSSLAFVAGAADDQPRQDLAPYRRYTVAIVRRYFRISLEIGRLPSLLGQQFFRARVTSYRMTSFEDAVIFVSDIENCLEDLDDFSRKLIAHSILEGYRRWETAHILNCPQRTVERHLPRALDELTRLFLRRGILKNFLCQ